MHRLATSLFVFVSLLMVLFGVTAVLFTLGFGEYLPGLSPQAVVSITGGLTREQLGAQEPMTVELLRAGTRVLSLGFLLWGLVSLVITIVPFRRRERWAWYVLWAYPVFFASLSAHEISLGAAGFFVFPLALLLISLSGLFISNSSFSR